MGILDWLFGRNKREEVGKTKVFREARIISANTPRVATVPNIQTPMTRTATNGRRTSWEVDHDSGILSPLWPVNILMDSHTPPSVPHYTVNCDISHSHDSGSSHSHSDSGSSYSSSDSGSSSCDSGGGGGGC